jgi:hypothetical protein
MRAMVIVLALVVGCKKDKGTETGTDTTGTTSLLGDGMHDVSGLLRVVGDSSDGLDRPLDLAFNPEVPGELWVVSQRDDSATIYNDPDSGSQVADHVVDPYALHFMEEVSSIAFGAPGTFATCQDSTNTYNDSAPPNYFMGPALWSSDRDIFGISNQAAIEAIGFDLGSHLDMLHESPECMGIAWDRKNRYWVFDGFHGSINMYDFAEDHGVGYDDHSDGIIERWVEGEVSREEGTMSHLELDKDSGLLYIADTGNNRIAVLDTNSGARGSNLPAKEPGTQHYSWDDATITTLVDGEALGMSKPSGLALIEGKLVVTDNATGRLHVFDLDGTELDWAETGRSRLAGVYGESLSDLWIVDQQTDEVLRLQN